jgi:hypothetical protein
VPVGVHSIEADEGVGLHDAAEVAQVRWRMRAGRASRQTTPRTRRCRPVVAHMHSLPSGARTGSGVSSASWIFSPAFT